MADIPIDITEIAPFVRQPDGSYKEVSYKIGEEYSSPIIITDYTDPTKRATVDAEGRLHVLADAVISADESPTKYQNRIAYDSVGVVVGATDVMLYEYIGEPGLLDFVGLQSGTSTYEAIIKIDGMEEIRLSMAQLSALGFSNGINVPIWAETADKNFRYHPKQGSGFSNRFSVWARATTGTNTVRFLITYREKV